jgi:hypothetical protein
MFPPIRRNRNSHKRSQRLRRSECHAGIPASGFRLPLRLAAQQGPGRLPGPTLCDLRDLLCKCSRCSRGIRNSHKRPLRSRRSERQAGILAAEFRLPFRLVAQQEPGRLPLPSLCDLCDLCVKVPAVPPKPGFAQEVAKITKVRVSCGDSTVRVPAAFTARGSTGNRPASRSVPL